VNEGRVKFIKGWFQNTGDQLVAALSAVGQLIVHYDADLYSSTFFALTKIDSLKRPYLAIFDEFAGHEARALRNYQQSYNPSIKFEAKTIAAGYPVRVLCRIAPVSSVSA
jgi:O-methyltransferase